MYIVRWDDFEGQQHELAFESLEDALLEAAGLERRDDVLYVETEAQKSAPSGGTNT